MKQLFSFLFLFVVLVVLSGCKKEENPTNPGGNNNIPSQSYPTPTNFNGVTPVNVLGVVRVSTPLPNGIPGSLDVNMGVANFGTPGVDKGEVKVRSNNKDFIFTKNTSNGAVSYVYTPSGTNVTGIDLNSGASTVTFSATGYSLTSGNVTVPGQITLNQPAANSNVARTNALNVTWTANNAGSLKAVFISDKNGKSYYKEASGSQAAFSASEMQSLAAGTAMVYAITYNYTLTNNNETVLIGEAVSFNTITLQ